ncbi:hypothetical protein B484DRAFT_146844 [Ochromonadaceae sp. CCMP2298]|nr:hypothetical protein B484DRAFT_146844 [Ochromonadaceae sp. CCMP2298]
MRAVFALLCLAAHASFALGMKVSLASFRKQAVRFGASALVAAAAVAPVYAQVQISPPRSSLGALKNRFSYSSPAPGGSNAPLFRKNGEDLGPVEPFLGRRGGKGGGGAVGCVRGVVSAVRRELCASDTRGRRIHGQRGPLLQAHAGREQLLPRRVQRECQMHIWWRWWGQTCRTQTSCSPA